MIQEESTQPGLAFSIEFFYGVATEELFDGWEEVDIAGLNLRATRTFVPVPEDPHFSVDLFGILGCGVGSYEETWRTAWYEMKTEATVIQTQLAFGSNLRYQLTRGFSVYGGGRLGAAYTSINVESSGGYDETKGDFGLLWGLGVGCEFSVGERMGIVLGYDYIDTTASPEDANEQAYNVFSVGLHIRY